MNNILLVGLGGFIGSVMRYLLSGYVQGSTKSVDFPFGTLAVNIITIFRRRGRQVKRNLSE